MLTPSDPELQKLLEAGVEAYNRGNRQRARDLFLQVVERDERAELAWMWLVEVVDDPQDKVTALENVLALNPGNTQAQTQLAQIRRQAEAPSPAGAPASAAEAWRSMLPEVTLEEQDGIEDPFQCAYCGRPTREKDGRCPHCRKSLYVRVTQSASSDFLHTATLIQAITAGVGVLEVIGPLMALTAQGGQDRSGFELLNRTFGLTWILGDYLKFTAAQIPWLIGVHAVRVGGIVALLLLLRQRWAWVYYTAIGFFIADILLSGYLFFTGSLGLVSALINAVFDLVLLVLLAASDREFPVNPVRLLTQPDSVARSASDYHRLGHEYRRRGMWALAVAQWRRAVGLAPQEIKYYTDLGIGYAQIKRYTRSVRVLQEALRLAPGDVKATEILNLVRGRAAKEGVKLE